MHHEEVHRPEQQKLKQVEQDECFSNDALLPIILS